MLTIDTPKKLPSVDRLANDPNNAFLVEEYGMPLVTQCVQNRSVRGAQAYVGGQDD